MFGYSQDQYLDDKSVVETDREPNSDSEEDIRGFEQEMYVYSTRLTYMSKLNL